MTHRLNPPDFLQKCTHHAPRILKSRPAPLPDLSHTQVCAHKPHQLQSLSNSNGAANETALRHSMQPAPGAHATGYHLTAAAHRTKLNMSRTGGREVVCDCRTTLAATEFKSARADSRSTDSPPEFAHLLIGPYSFSPLNSVLECMPCFRPSPPNGYRAAVRRIDLRTSCRLRLAGEGCLRLGLRCSRWG